MVNWFPFPTLAHFIEQKGHRSPHLPLHLISVNGLLLTDYLGTQPSRDLQIRRMFHCAKRNNQIVCTCCRKGIRLEKQIFTLSLKTVLNNYILSGEITTLNNRHIDLSHFCSAWNPAATNSLQLYTQAMVYTILGKLKLIFVYNVQFILISDLVVFEYPKSLCSHELV